MQESSSDVLKLCNMLLAWLYSDRADGVKPATVESLRVALAGSIVGLKKIAQKLETLEKPVASAPAEKKPCMESKLRVLYRSLNSIVSEAKSTLLEVHG